MRQRQVIPDSVCRVSRFAFLRIFVFPLIGRVLMVWVALGLAVAFGQDASTGALRGSVVDAQGAGVTKADVVAICVETGIRYHAATDMAGRFTVDLLPPGNYSARLRRRGCHRRFHR